MSDHPSLFLFATAAGTVRQVGALIRACVAEGWTTYVVGTPNIDMVEPADSLLDVPGAHWIRGYNMPPLDVFPFGTMLVAPCTFNTFNKLAAGLADNLATAMVADALGAGCPVFIAPSMNPGLWSHPRTRESERLLRDWGCTIIGPQISPGRVTMAPIDDIISALRGHM